MRKKKAIINIGFSLLLEIVTVISGFIVPRMIIGAFGSETNGLMNSILNFIGYIGLLQSGVGSVIRASLYKPLASKDHDSLCVILKTTENFFRKLAYITVAYIGVLGLIFPLLITPGFDFWYTLSLVVIIGISTAAQYFFGITYQMLLEADQRSYVYSIVQIITIIFNSVATVLLIQWGASVQLVKLVSAVFFVLRPFTIGLYAKRKYKINTKAKIDNRMIAQRWDGVAQAIAYFIHSKAPVFVLTLLSTLTNVSIYSVYALVTTGLTSFLNCIDKAVKAAFGNIIANKEQKTLQKTFSAYSNLIHMFATVCFATAAITVFRFVSVYTAGIVDANYQQPLFGVLVITAEYVYCLRMPYNGIINVAGKFKETKRSAFIEAGSNVVISCALVPFFGLVGVAIGTLAAMVYRTVSFGIYLHNNVLMLPYVTQIKRFAVTLCSYGLSIFLLSKIDMTVTGYLDWAVYAAIIFLLVTALVALVNFVCLPREFKASLKRFMK